MWVRRTTGHFRDSDGCSCPSFLQFDLPGEEYADCLPDGELLALPLLLEERNFATSGPGGLVPSPSLDFNDNEDIPTELSDSSETHDEGNGTEQDRPTHTHTPPL